MSITIIGLGMAYQDLTARQLAMIEQADVLVGGERHLGPFASFKGQKIAINRDLKSLSRNLDRLQSQGHQIVVLASGDPLFFGIGAYLLKQLGKQAIEIVPNVSSVAAAFARIKTAWQDAKVISLHGRALDGRHVDDLKTHDKVAILTDEVYTPSRVYDLLVENSLEQFNICILERLGDEAEALYWFAPGEPIRESYLHPNLMILLRAPEQERSLPPQFYPGMADDCFQHERGLITKAEIRVVSLSKLMLENDTVMWDLGAGSGAVAIEAAFYIRKGQIYAVEKNPARVALIKENQRHFQVAHLEVIQGVLPDALEQLPDPDRVFIGGGGVDLVEIIQQSAARLRPGGLMVINTVLLKNMAGSIDTLEQLGFEPEVIQLQVNYGHKMPWNQMLKSHNPVWIIKGAKP